MSKLLSMMKKNDQYMLLNKVGTPTITDGVVSGFSASNYLKLPEYSGTINSLELVFKLTTAPITITNSALICSLNGDVNFRVFVRTQNTIRIAYRDIADDETKYVTSTNVVSDNLYIKCILDNSGIKLFFSSNGINWNLEASTTNKAKLSNLITDGQIGYQSSTFNVYDGSIDIYNSYIKINGTKYLFEFVMPLTMVGNITINNGIVSGFSADDYVRTPLIDNIESASLDLVINYDIPLNNDAMRIFRFGTATSNAYQLRWSNGGNIQYYAKTKRFASNKEISNYKYIRLTTENGLENNVQIFVSNNGNTWEQAILQENALEQSFTNTQIILGRIIKGNINFKNSYIIINGTKYVFRIYDDNNFDFTDMFALS